jgi:hypothetical protein
MIVRAFAFTVLLFGATGAGYAQDKDKDSFSGTWLMDASRSESAHQDVPIKPSTLVIAISSGSMTLETAHQEDSRKAVDQLIRVNLDGSESTTVVNGVSIKAKGRWEGQTLIIDTVRNIQQAMVTTQDVYVLGSQGRELTVEKTLNVQHGYEGNAMDQNVGHGKDVFMRVDK